VLIPTAAPTARPDLYSFLLLHPLPARTCIHSYCCTHCPFGTYIHSDCCTHCPLGTCIHFDCCTHCPPRLVFIPTAAPTARPDLYSFLLLHPLPASLDLYSFLLLHPLPFWDLYSFRLLHPLPARDLYSFLLLHPLPARTCIHSYCCTHCPPGLVFIPTAAPTARPDLYSFLLKRTRVIRSLSKYRGLILQCGYVSHWLAKGMVAFSHIGRGCNVGKCHSAISPLKEL
jgi:hypothetical protein